MREKLEVLYGRRARETCERIERLLASHTGEDRQRGTQLWDQRDLLLITYGDQLRKPGQAPLRTLCHWLEANGLGGLVSTVHLLPFFPYSSDDGFSVMDYLRVDPALGDWDDIARFRQSFDLMFDLVVNHCSSQGAWFRAYLAGQPPYSRYFLEASPEADLSMVTRPRSLPLLSPVETAAGSRHVWTTFSADQVDLDFSNPEVLTEMLGIALEYARRGARILRLDAIAYLWKEIGTRCINLLETHLIVKLIRQVLDRCYPGTLVLTETNLPHAENVSYFGDGDEAHIVYQFSLPPLVLDAYLQQDAQALAGWLGTPAPEHPRTTYLNFLASHDGIGLRPLEGLLSQERCEAVVGAGRARGGRVSTRTDKGGRDRPYELNISWFSALGDGDGEVSAAQVQRFLASHALLFALRGIPALYFHSLVGTPNHDEGVLERGMARAINRRKFGLAELSGLMADEGTHMPVVLERMKAMMAARARQAAFHPDVHQRVCESSSSRVLAFERGGSGPERAVLVLVNFGDKAEDVEVSDATVSLPATDVLSGTERGAGGQVRLAPFEAVWLTRT